jgi:large conductance mechanosensitive channel
MKQMLREFREFAMRGNVVDLAVGVIIGASFGKIVSSLVADIVMPLLALIIGSVNFADLFVTLHAAEGDKPAVLLAYGKFIQAVFDFVIVAFAIFLAVKGINRVRRRFEAEPPAVAPAPTAQEKLLMEIRDLLKARS